MNRKFAVLVLGLLISSLTRAQLPDLCGIWWGHDYQCTVTLPDGRDSLVNLRELVVISTMGQHVLAKKITGDDCVPAGETTFRGTFSQNPFDVTYNVGNPTDPACCFMDTYIYVQDANHMYSGKGMWYERAECEELESMGIYPAQYGISCMNCKTEQEPPEPTVVSPVSLTMPNVFSPNGDGINDVFKATYSGTVIDFQLEIYDRWGKQIKVFRNPNAGWDGMKNGNACPDGVYYWSVRYNGMKEPGENLTGWVTLLR